MDRRDSKKSKQKSNNNKDSSAKSKGEEFDDERRGKGSHGGSGGGAGVIRSKPCREIYRPPIVRKGRGSNSSNNSNSENSSEQSATSVTTGSSLGYVSSVPNSPLAHSSSSPSASSSRPFNVHAKEFQYPSNNANQMGYSRSQPISYFPTSPTECYAGSILATSGCYPLNQSKSSGNLNHFYQLWAHQQQQQQQQQQQASPLTSFPLKQEALVMNKRRSNTGMITEIPKSPTDPSADNPYFVLQQSKSSGNIPGRVQRNGKTVRFDFHDPSLLPTDIPSPGAQPQSPIESRLSKMQRDIELTEKSLASLEIDGQKLNNVSGGKSSRLYEREDFQEAFRSPTLPTKFSHPPPPLLQKSHTFFHVPSAAQAGPTTKSEATPAKSSVTIKRSKSYTPRSSQAKLSLYSNPTALSSSPSSSSLVSLSPISASSDFEITKWPQNIQESVTTAVIGAERVPARHRIAMVGKILDILFSGNPAPVRGDGRLGETSKNEKKDSPPSPTGHPKNDAGPSQASHIADRNQPPLDSINALIPSAVNIFLYFIQREKDRTVMETVLNTCYATYQQLHKLSLRSQENLPTNNGEVSLENGTVKLKWWTFLQFLSSMYAKLKIIRLQKSQQPGMKSIDELNNSVLSVMCDSCLLTLRTPLLHTTEIMDLLFTIMTSIGREMEGTFPMKMKQILAAVRDALLGIKPYPGCTDVSSPNVQKTLMQLIELHAANWHLPASAVRYYYSIPM